MQRASNNKQKKTTKPSTTRVSRLSTKRNLKKTSTKRTIPSLTSSITLKTPLFTTFNTFSTTTEPTAAKTTNAAAPVDPTVTTNPSTTDPDAPQYYMGPDLYTLRPVNVREGARVIRAFSNTQNDQPISLAINLGLDPRKPNQSVRGMAPVPHGSGGKTVLAVFATGDKAAEAKAAGADIVGAEDLIKDIIAGKIEFTRCVATPDMMKHLSKVARILGPKGLMPNPKLGTVTVNIKEAVENSKLGQLEFRNDKKGVVHCIIGKSSWSVDKIEENVNAFVKAIADAKPSGAKGQYFKSSYIGNNTGWSQSLDIRLFPFKQ